MGATKQPAQKQYLHVTRQSFSKAARLTGSEFKESPFFIETGKTVPDVMALQVLENLPCILLTSFPVHEENEPILVKLAKSA